MARTINEIKGNMTAAFIADETIISFYELTPGQTFDQQFSKVSIESIIFYIIASAIWALESIFDMHKSDVEDIIANKSPHSLQWYQNIGKAFQYGHSLMTDSDKYLVIDEEAQIIKHCTVNESEGFLRYKVAKNIEGELGELTAAEMAAFTTYIQRVKDAGVKITVTSREADYLRLVIDIHYDPLVFDSNGQRIDGENNTPVQNTINNYLSNLPFDGEFTIAALTDALQKTDGVKIPQVLSAESKWGEYNYSVIRSNYTPEAGWMKVYDLENDLTINWIAYGSE